MAKVKVLMSFVDIHTNAVHPVGEIFDADNERIKEIKSVRDDLIQVIREEKKKVGAE